MLSPKNEWIQSFQKYSGIKTLTRGILLELVHHITISDYKKIEITWNFRDEFQTLCKHTAVVIPSAGQTDAEVLRNQRSNVALLHPTDLLRGLLVCETCGRVLAKNPSKIPYYYCLTGKNAPNMPCTEVKIERAALEQMVLSSLHTLLQLLPQTQDVVGESDSGKNYIRKRLEQLKTETDKCKAEQVILFERFADGKMDRQRYLAEKQASAGRMDALAVDVEHLNAQLQVLGRIVVFPAGKDLGKYAYAKTLTRELLVELVKEIRVSGTDTVEIIWNFKSEYTAV